MYRLLLSYILFVIIAVPPVFAEEVAILTDTNGKVAISMDGKGKAILLGSSLSGQDVITVSKGASVTIVLFKGCKEWQIKGPGKVKIYKDRVEKLEGFRDAEFNSRQLPVCYNPKSGSDAYAPAGGVVLRSSSEPMEDLIEEFKAGKASNSTLITLINYLVFKRDEPAAALPYFEELKRRIPDSEYVTSISRYFKK